MEKNYFVKSHGLGNDYIVLTEDNIDFTLNESMIRLICDCHFGIGSDGILLKVPSLKADFGLRIFNPDGSEAEKSGNGLRIFCKYLYDHMLTDKKEFSVETPGGIVFATIIRETGHRADLIRVDMGRATFDPPRIPVNVNLPECFDFPLKIGDREFSINCVSLGNPHCVIIKDELDREEVMQFGPLIEKHPLFPNRINVQFAKVLSPVAVQAMIWERGAGYTLASGSSSCAVASVMVKKHLTESDLTVNMEGGSLQVSIDKEWNIRMTGEVREIATGYLSSELTLGKQ